MAIIEVKHLTKTFQTKQKQSGFLGSLQSLFHPQRKTVEAVRDLNFTIQKGERVAFIGPNGAGKSTTLKMLTGILYPTSGDISLLGYTPQRDRKKLSYELGTVFGQKSQLWYHLPPMDTYDLFAAIFDIDKNVYAKRLQKLIKQFDIQDFIHTPVRKLSLGQRMRCELVAALLHQPKILLLDEPTIGLDILSKKALRNAILEFNKKEKTTILLTSHDVDDIENVCERIIIINQGQLVYDKPLDDLKSVYLQKKIIKLQLEERTKKPLKRKGIRVVADTDLTISYEVDTTRQPLQDAIKQLLSYHLNILDITIQEVSVEEIIEEIYKQK
ncbi:MAG: ATP-binding cassette domain-containing protein [Nanoarchaeota archaeon]|nr:ATP-binding cassette domain-containing protein [Nanoarchaeota archaeon]